MLAVTVLAADSAAAEPCVEGVEVSWVTSDGEQQKLLLEDAARVAFEHGLPARSYKARKGQRHLSGRWWCATTGRHVGFESWLERDHVMLLDFDPMVTGIAAQPFWLSWRNGSGGRTSHAPDFFARRADGSGLVVDCRPVERRPEADMAKFGVTEQACARLGWEYRLVGGIDAVMAGNVRWLAGYRHPRHDLGEVGTRLREAFAIPRGLMEGASAVGDPIAVLPVLFHLLWRQELTAALDRSLGEATRLVTAGSGVGS